MKSNHKEFAEMKSGSLSTHSSAAKRMQRRQLLCPLVLYGLLVSASAFAAETPGKSATSLGIQVDSNLTHDDNVTRGYESILSDSFLNIGLRKSAIFPVSSNTQALLTGLLDGEIFQHYGGLSRISGGAKGELRYRSSAEFAASTYSLFAHVYLDQYNSGLRDGQRYSAGATFRRPLSDRIRLFAALAHNQRNAASDVFDTSDKSLNLNLDYDLNRNSTIYLGADFRRGDIVTTGSGLYVLNTSAWDDAFPDNTMYSTRLSGSTLITTLGYNMGLGSRESLDFSWRRISSTLDDASKYELYNLGVYTAGYTTNQYSVAYLLRL